MQAPEHPSEPLVTVLIDTYNYGHLIGRAVESVLAQTYPATQIDILVIDDGSTDGTADLVQAYGDRIRYVFKPNGGQASTLNEGFRRARGDIICLLDADDYFYPNKIQRVADVFRRHEKVGVVYNKLDVVLSDGTKLKQNWPTYTYAGNLQARTLLGYSWGPPTSSISVRKRVIDQLTIPEDTFRICPDYFLTSILPLVTYVGVVDSAESTWYFHGANQGLLNNAFVQQYGDYTRRYHAAIRRYAQERLGKRFVTYLGRSGYATGSEDSLLGRAKVEAFLLDARQIVQAEVEGGIKLQALVKLLLSALPHSQYERIKQLKSALVRFYLHEVMHLAEGDHDLDAQAQKGMAIILLQPSQYIRHAGQLSRVLSSRLRARWRT
jgi:glycosyltransferase involved in cell wall biosynthesis